MFWINFKYTLKALFHNKSLLFWTYAFPIILGMLFNLAFQDLEKKEARSTYDIAIVQNEAWQDASFYQEAMKELSSGDDPLFHIEYTSKKEADRLLKEKNVIGYLELQEEDFDVFVTSNGMEETILQYVADELTSTKDMIVDVSIKEVDKEIKKGNYNIQAERIEKKVREILDTEVNLQDVSLANMSYTNIEYYTLIAMACLYGGTISIYIMNGISADISSKGKRFSVTPIKKGVLILSSLCAGFLTQIIGIGALLAFMLLMGNANFGDSIGNIILLSMAGSLAGLSLGIFVSSVVKMNKGNKDGLLIGISMLCSFFSGMMGMTMKYIIDTNLPILNKINPAAMITDGFYALYYYHNNERFTFDLISLLVFSAILLTISLIKERRVSYDSL